MSQTLLPIVALLAASQPAAEDILRTPETVAALAHRFTPEDEQLLDEIQSACFQYFWKEVGQPACLAKDRVKGPVASIAAVGFQLSSLPVGVERKWITRAQGQERALTVLRSLTGRTDNKRWGMYMHFPDHHTAGPSHHGYLTEASTVDTALLLAGAIPAAEYFGGEVKALVDRMIAEANWKQFATGPNGFIYMSWKSPDGVATLDGEGKLSAHCWERASDEERLVYLLAVGTPVEAHAVPAETYYKLSRTVKRHKDMPPFVVSWPGNMFTYFFAHCWIDYRGLGADEPRAFGVDLPRVDGWENSRRAALTHRQRCAEIGEKYKTPSLVRWGMSACASRDGYIVPETRPNVSDNELLCGGTIAPYAAGSCIMFTPQESMEALRAFRALKGPEGKPFAWREVADGGYGLVDSFNLDQGHAHDDWLGIDQGPMLLAIENVRTGLIWKLFMQNEHVQRALKRLKIGPEKRVGSLPDSILPPDTRTDQRTLKYRAWG
jgi:hypothetical protein